MRRQELQRRIRSLEVELRDWFDLAGQRALTEQERHSAVALEKRIDRLRWLLSLAGGSVERV